MISWLGCIYIGNIRRQLWMATNPANNRTIERWAVNLAEFKSQIGGNTEEYIYKRLNNG